MLYTPRKLKFKAWNTDEKLLMRLDSIGCNRGELIKQGHILLQFTGMTDKHEEEIYDMDILLQSSHKFVVRWNDEKISWFFSPLENLNEHSQLTQEAASTMLRLCSYFEGDKK
jgi:YopX protein